MIEGEITSTQVYSLIKKLQESKFPCKDNERELQIIKNKDNSGKIFLQEYGSGLICSKGFFVEKDYWNILKPEYINAGYKIKKEKISKKDLIGSIFWGAITLSLIMPLLYFAGAEIKTEKLKKQIYKIVDTNNNHYLEYEEWIQLGKGLELIAKDEVLSAKEIEEKINKLEGFGRGLKKFGKYLENNK